MTVIGIDLGTTYSCVGVYHHSRIDDPVEIVKNNMGKEKTPSYIAFTDDGILVGADAKEQSIMNPTNTVYDILTLIGRKFDDPIVQNRMKYWPFKVVSDTSSKPIVEVQFKGKKKQLYPEEIIAILLNYMKELAENHLNEKVSNVVITIPAYFGTNERQSIVDSCAIAGLNVIRFISKSSAAAITFWKKTKLATKKMVLIIDFGGGSTEFSIVDIYNDKFDVLYMSSEMNLSGRKIDNDMFDYFYNRFCQKTKDKPKFLPRSKIKLHKSCKDSKELLTIAAKAYITCTSFSEGYDFTDSILRDDFENNENDLFESAINQIKLDLEHSNIYQKITDIVLIGGSSRIPILLSKITQKIQKLIPGKTITRVIDPDTSSVYGATLYAAAIQNGIFVFNDSLPYSLGFETKNGSMTCLLQKSLLFPSKKVFSTHVNSLPNKALNVYELKISNASKNRFIGKLNLEDISEEDQQIEITFDVNEFGILNIMVLDVSAGKKYNISKENFGLFTQDKINRMIKNFQEYKQKIVDPNKDDDDLTSMNKDDDDLNDPNKDDDDLTSTNKDDDDLTSTNKDDDDLNDPNKDDENMKYFENKGKIGEGATSKTYKYINKRTNMPMCKKVLKISESQDLLKIQQNAIKEFEILNRIDHPCICKSFLIDIAEKMDEDEDKTTIALYLEYLQYSLTDILKTKISNTMKVKIVIEIAHGMNYLHKKGMIHRDLKIENIMLNSIFQTKLIDFGLIKISENFSESLTKGIGTFNYMSPEMLNEQDYDNKTDVYSFGVVLYYMFVGGLPKQTMKEKLNGKKIKLPKPSSSISEFCLDLIDRCLNYLPKNRPSFEEILNLLRENSYELADDIDPYALRHVDEYLNDFDN